MARNDINTCCVVGYLVADPELKYLANEMAVINYKIANNRIVSKEKEKTNWINCTAYGKLAEIAYDYIKKGTRVTITGELEAVSGKKEDGSWWNRNGIICREIDFGGNNGAGEGKPTSKKTEPSPTIRQKLEETTEEDIPMDTDDFPWE